MQTSAPTRTLDDIALLMRSFATDGDAFYFFGASSMEQVEERIANLHLNTVPLVRDPIARRPPIQLDYERICYSEPPQPPQPPPPLRTAHRPRSAPAAVESAQSAREPSPPPPAVVPLSRPPLVMPIGHKPVLVFDTETTGLSPPIVCQLAYVVVENGAVAIEYDQLLKLPQGVRIGKQAQAVHGVSNQDVAARGVGAADALELFARTCARILLAGGRVVAHNSSFDVRAVRETRLAHNVIDHDENQTLELKDTFCTMKHSKEHSPLKDKAGRRKAFKNDELYLHNFGSPPSWARLHDASSDVMVTVLNYAEGLRREWW
jgi:DNA polymerase III epsilon subunit-like protein